MMGKDQQREVGGEGKGNEGHDKRGGIKSKTEKRRGKERRY